MIYICKHEHRHQLAKHQCQYHWLNVSPAFWLRLTSILSLKSVLVTIKLTIIIIRTPRIHNSVLCERALSLYIFTDLHGGLELINIFLSPISTHHQALAGSRESRYPGIFSWSKSRDFGKWNPGIFRDLLVEWKWTFYGPSVQWGAEDIFENT